MDGTDRIDRTDETVPCRHPRDQLASARSVCVRRSPPLGEDRPIALRPARPLGTSARSFASLRSASDPAPPGAGFFSLIHPPPPTRGRRRSSCHENANTFKHPAPGGGLHGGFAAASRRAASARASSTLYPAVFAAGPASALDPGCGHKKGGTVRGPPRSLRQDRPACPRKGG